MKKFFSAVAVVAVLSIAAGLFLNLSSKIEKVEQLNGSTEKYFFMKKLVGERTYQNGKLEGRTATYYYTNGNLKAEWTYSAGKRNGIARHYALDGNLKYEDEYADDKRVSRKEYDNKGNIVSTTT